MALARIKTWIAGEILTASDLNAEVDNLLNQALALISPLTGNLNVNNTQLLNAVLQNLAVTPAAGTIGRAWWHTGEDLIEVDDGATVGRVPASEHSQFALAAQVWG